MNYNMVNFLKTNCISNTTVQEVVATREQEEGEEGEREASTASSKEPFSVNTAPMKAMIGILES